MVSDRLLTSRSRSPAAKLAALLLALAGLLARTDALSATPLVKDKLRVLCLHGYAQNGAALRDRSGAFRRPLKKARFELTFLDAPFICTSADGEGSAAPDPTRRAWWRASDDATPSYDGWAESRAQLVNVWRTGSFDGVFGFSQGAAAAAMLCADVRPRFAVLVAGFVPRDNAAAAPLHAGLDGVPSLHVIGRSDAVVAPARSRALATLFGGAHILEHDGGHMLPSRAGVREGFTAFLDSLDLEPTAAPSLSVPLPPFGPHDTEWDDLDALESEFALSDAIEQRNRAQLESFINADAQWAAQDEGDRWLLRRKPLVEQRIEELRMQRGAGR